MTREDRLMGELMDDEREGRDGERTTTPHWTDALEPLRPCRDALRWARTQPDYATAWAACRRGDWMLWLIGKLDRSAPWTEARKPLVRVALACGRLALEYTTDPRVSEGLNTVDRWLAGDATQEDVRQAETYAAWVAGDAAEDEDWAARVPAGVVNWAAGVAGDAAEDEDWAAARAAMRRQCATIVRREFPHPPALRSRITRTAQGGQHGDDGGKD